MLISRRMKPPLALLLVPALLLAACNPEKPPVVNALSGTMAEGELVPDSENNNNLVFKSSAWTGGAGTVKTVVLPDMSDLALMLTSTPLSADGKFSFATLPAPPADTLTPISAGSQTQPDCTGEIKFSDPATQGIDLFISVKTDLRAGLARQLVIDTTGNITKTSGLVYVDRDLKVSGTLRCTFTGTDNLTRVSVNDNDVQLHKGWNSLVGSVKTETVGTVMTTTTTTRAGTLGDAKWYLLGGSSAQPLSLQKSRLPSFSFFR